MAPKKKWIQGAVRPEHKGEFSAKAKAAGMSTAAYAAHVMADKNAPEHLKKQANFAKVTIAMHRHHRIKEAGKKK